MTDAFDRRTAIAGLLTSSCLALGNAQGTNIMPPDYSNLPPDRRAQAEAMFARMMAALPYERTTIAGADATAEQERLSKLGKGWPVIIGNDEALERIANQFSIGDAEVFGKVPGLPAARTPAAILEAARAIDFPKDLTNWPGAYQSEDLRAPIGEWPHDLPEEPDTPILGVTANFATGQPFDRVHVLFVPTSHSWEVPAYLRWGDWNACPPPEYHVAALRRWHDAYGAELVGINGDTMDLWVPRPPQIRPDAISVAKEIYHYCPDDVDQGTQTLSALAATMVTRRWWTFWWD